MRVMSIPKGNGSFRKVVVPSKHLKQRLRDALPALVFKAMALDVWKVQHGFTPGRSPVTNARAHLGFRHTVTMDLEDCFDHLSLWLMNKLGLASVLVDAMTGASIEMYFHRDVARQGLPTSPAICNLVLAALDDQIVTSLNGRGVYTRYADDLTISSDNLYVLKEMMVLVPVLARSVCQTVHHRKTHLQHASQGRRIITGVAVGDHRLYPTRLVKRRLRAALHQGNTRQARGLREWCRLRSPDVTQKMLRLTSGRQYDRWLAMLLYIRKFE